jgi:pseudaminic acid synthase
MKTIKIADRSIGADFPPFVIAELSANHNGKLDRAIEIIKMVKHAGADAVKLQTYTANTMTIDCDNDDFRINGGLWDGYNLYQLYKEAHTPLEWHKQLFDTARELDLLCFSTPFDEEGVDLLEDLNAPAYKVASFEAIDLPLIKYISQTGKPMIISTGMANQNEISEAVETARSSGCNDLVLLHCISAYPAPANEANLKTIPDLAKRFGVLAGLSDHTLGTAVAVSSVALGAVAIEKHVTLSRQDKGPDSEFSLEPDELARLCKDIKTAWEALGCKNYERTSSEKDNAKFRRSIYAVADIRAGETLTSENIRRIRPGFGLPPKHFEELLGSTAKNVIRRGTPLSWDLIVDKHK